MHIRTLSSSSNESNYRTAAYEAITSFLTHAANDVLGVVETTTVTILQRMEHLLSVQVKIVDLFFRSSLY